MGFIFCPQWVGSEENKICKHLKLRTRVAVAQRIESFTDDEEGCGFESHQSHASSEALGFRHLEPLSFICPKGRVSSLWLRGRAPSATKKTCSVTCRSFPFSNVFALF